MPRIILKQKNHGKLSNDPNLIVIDDNSLNALMAETFAENGARTNTAAKGMMDKVLCKELKHIQLRVHRKQM